MRGSAAREREQWVTSGVDRLRLASGPALGPVLCRVVSMVLTRADWPVDRLDEALLVCDALCAHGPGYASNGHLTFSVQAGEREVELRLHELERERAEALLRDTRLPVVGNVLEQVADRVAVVSDADGSDRVQIAIVLSPN